MRHRRKKIILVALLRKSKKAPVTLARENEIVTGPETRSDSKTIASLNRKRS